MNKSIDFNCDLGEGFGAYKMGEAAQIMPYISSANIACGFHAGDPVIMDSTVKLAIAHRVAIGAHPGYPDLQGFGRRSIALNRHEIQSMLMYQIGALKAITEGNGARLCHVKPHGALYNDAAKNPELAAWIAEAIFTIDPSLIMIGFPDSPMSEAAKAQGLPFAAEFFADRRYLDDGSLCPRNRPEAVIHDPEECIGQVKEMILNGLIPTIGGKCFPVKADTLCLHGDSIAAITLARLINNALSEAGVRIRPLESINKK